MRWLAFIGVLLLGAFLGACQTANQEGYVRAKGRTNPQQLQLVLAQCQGEAHATPQGFYIDSLPVRGGAWVGLAGNVIARAAQVDAVTSACMARHGYVMAQAKP
jgi:hypothetical protein